MTAGKGKEIDKPNDPARDSDSRAPLFGRWRYWYIFTAGMLGLYIVLLIVFSRLFS